jgi:hypothetical protein
MERAFELLTWLPLPPNLICAVLSSMDLFWTNFYQSFFLSLFFCFKPWIITLLEHFHNLMAVLIFNLCLWASILEILPSHLFSSSGFGGTPPQYCRELPFALKSGFEAFNYLLPTVLLTQPTYSIYDHSRPPYVFPPLCLVYVTVAAVVNLGNLSCKGLSKLPPP